METIDIIKYRRRAAFGIISVGADRMKTRKGIERLAQGRTPNEQSTV